ncbi:MAG TPA: hypothetical protein VOA80_06410, partial [Thermoanaerobaculia bacterium]|nr:hypothetical protein [Thermoanaerobaculia bacterium]
LALVRTERSLRPRFDLLVSIPGVGSLTALALLAEYGPELAHASPRQLPPSTAAFLFGDQLLGLSVAWTQPPT